MGAAEFEPATSRVGSSAACCSLLRSVRRCIWMVFVLVVASARTVAAISAVGRFSSAGGVADLQAAIAAGVAAYRAEAVTR